MAAIRHLTAGYDFINFTGKDWLEKKQKGHSESCLINLTDPTVMLFWPKKENPTAGILFSFPHSQLSRIKLSNPLWERITFRMHENAPVSKNLMFGSSRGWNLKKLVIQVLSFSLQMNPQPPSDVKNKTRKNIGLSPVRLAPLNRSLPACFSPFMFKFAGKYDPAFIYMRSKTIRVLFTNWNWVTDAGGNTPPNLNQHVMAVHLQIMHARDDELHQHDLEE